jgi:hypothetical protein
MFSARGKNRTVNIEAIIILWFFIGLLNRLSCVEIDLVTVIRSTKHQKSYTELLFFDLHRETVGTSPCKWNQSGINLSGSFGQKADIQKVSRKTTRFALS